MWRRSAQATKGRERSKSMRPTPRLGKASHGPGPHYEGPESFKPSAIISSLHQIDIRAQSHLI